MRVFAGRIDVLHIDGSLKKLSAAVHMVGVRIIMYDKIVEFFRMRTRVCSCSERRGIYGNYKR